jgi:hypothetical protein
MDEEIVHGHNLLNLGRHDSSGATFNRHSETVTDLTEAFKW